MMAITFCRRSDRPRGAVRAAGSVDRRHSVYIRDIQIAVIGNKNCGRTQFAGGKWNGKKAEILVHAVRFVGRYSQRILASKNKHFLPSVRNVEVLTTFRISNYFTLPISDAATNKNNTWGLLENLWPRLFKGLVYMTCNRASAQFHLQFWALM